MLKTQIFEKKANFPVTVKKCFWPVPSRNLKGDEPQGPICEYPQAVLAITLEVKGIILQQLRSCWKHNFLKKKAKFPVKKRFWPIFSQVIECDGPQRTIFEGPQGILTITVQVKGLIL